MIPSKDNLSLTVYVREKRTEVMNDLVPIATIVRSWLPEVGELLVHTGDIAYKTHSHWNVVGVYQHGEQNKVDVVVVPVDPEPGVQTYRLMNYSAQGSAFLGKTRRYLPPPIGSWLPGAEVDVARQFDWRWTAWSQFHYPLLGRTVEPLLAGEKPPKEKALWWEVKCLRWFGKPWPVQINLEPVHPNEVRKRNPVAEPNFEYNINIWMPGI